MVIQPTEIRANDYYCNNIIFTKFLYYIVDETRQPKKIGKEMNKQFKVIFLLF